MSTCYKCGVELRRKKDVQQDIMEQGLFASREHIIPNFCGGHLKSWDLLCSKCNNELGLELDSELSDQLLFHRLFPIKLDHGYQNDGFVIAYTQVSKEKILVNKNLDWKRYKPKIATSEDGKILEFTCNTEKEARQILLSIKKKNPNIDVEKSLKQIKQVEEFLEERIDFNHRVIGGPKTFRAFAKIAVNYFLFTGGKKSLIKDVIGYVCKRGIKNTFVVFYYTFSTRHKLGAREVSHIIFLKGDNIKHLLYCYVELFSTVNFIVILNRTYNEENFTKQYCYDVLSDKLIEDKIINVNPVLDPFELLKFRHYQESYLEETEEYMRDKVTRTLQILSEIAKPL